MLIPKGKYSGQKLTKLVSKNTPPNTSKAMPNVSEVMIFVKYSATIMTATMTLAILSGEPMFFFIATVFEVLQ